MNLAAAKYAAQYEGEGIVFLCITPGLVKTKEGSESILFISLALEIHAELFRLSLCAAKEETEAFYDQQVKQIRSKYPEFEGAITPEQSARDQLDLIHRVTIQQTGGFVNRDGTDAESTV